MYQLYWLYRVFAGNSRHSQCGSLNRNWIFNSPNWQTTLNDLIMQISVGCLKPKQKQKLFRQKGSKWKMRETSIMKTNKTQCRSVNNKHTIYTYIYRDEHRWWILYTVCLCVGWVLFMYDDDVHIYLINDDVVNAALSAFGSCCCCCCYNR